MKKQMFIVGLLTTGVIFLGGCWGSRSKKPVKQDNAQYMPDMNVDGQKVAFFDDKDIAASERLVLDDSAQSFAVVDASKKVGKDSKVIYFGYDSSHPRADQKAAIKEVQQQINEWTEQGYEVAFCGHACKYHGTDVYNVALSEKRAQEAAKVCAVDTKKVKIFGVGNEQPVVTEDMSRDGQAPNRRVEVYPVAVAA